MSWAAHQFEVYLVHAHLPRRMRGDVSFWAVAAGDFLPDFLSKFWVYGITIGGRHYGASVPHQWHRGWPGMGITHTVAFGLVAAARVVVEAEPGRDRRHRARLRRARGGRRRRHRGRHAAVPVQHGVVHVDLWAYGATSHGGKYLDAAAYYSSFGMVADVVWLLALLLLSWRALTRDHWRDRGRPRRAPPVGPARHGHARAGVAGPLPRTVLLRPVPDDRLDAVGPRPGPTPMRVGPLVPVRSRPAGPWWIDGPVAPARAPWLVLPVDALVLVGVYAAAIALWEPMGRAEARSARAEPVPGQAAGSRIGEPTPD